MNAEFLWGYESLIVSMARNEKFGCRDAKASDDEPEWESMDEWGFDYEANEMKRVEGREAIPEGEEDSVDVEDVQHGEQKRFMLDYNSLGKKWEYRSFRKYCGGRFTGLD